MTLYGQPLATNYLDNARGTFSLPDGTPITATWAFGCSQSSQDVYVPRLELQLNLETIHEQPTTAHFKLTLEYTPSGTIVDWTGLSTSSTLEPPVEVFNKLGQHEAVLIQGPGGLQSYNELTEEDIDSLPTQELTREDGHGWVMVKRHDEDEETYQNGFIPKYDTSAGSEEVDSPTSKSSKNCHSWRCLIGSATHGLKSKASQMYHELEHLNSHGESLKTSSSSESQKSDATKTGKATPSSTSGGETYHVIQNLAVNPKMKPLQPVAVAAAPSPIPTAQFLESIVSLRLSILFWSW